jgi:uncharacterized protein YbjT (DUF2867 family)
MKRVLVAGATGYLGHYVVKEVKKQGYWVRALARTSYKLEDLRDYIDEEFIGEVINPSSLNEICKDIDIVFSSVGITTQKDKLTYMDVDYKGNKNILEQAIRSGVSKFIYVHVLNANKISNLKIIQAKELFVKALKQSDLDHTIIYPTGYYSDMLEILKMAKKGRGFLFGSGDNRINPIHGSDLAEACVNTLTSTDKEIEVGGPEIFTYKEIMELAFETLGKKAKITFMPVWVGNITLLILRKLTSVKTYGPLEFFMTASTMDMVGNPYGKENLRDFYMENIN